MDKLRMLDGCYRIGKNTELVMASRPEDAKDGLWTDGDVICARTEKKACGVAMFLEMFGYDVVTGFFDVEEDMMGKSPDKYAGWWYVEVI